MKYIITIATAAIIIATYSAQSQSQKITFKAPKVYPEGVAFNSKTNVAYVSSVKTGTIGSVDAQGKYHEIYKDKDLKSSFGMKVDEKKNKLWVCIGDPNFSDYKSPDTFKKMARVISIDLSTGKKADDIDLSGLSGGNHFPNDLAIDNKDNLYITDSFSPVIYKIDAKGTPSIWAQSDLFKSIDVGLNGIVVHPDGFLLVAHNTNGAVLKVDLKDPLKVEKVNIPTFFPGADGLAMDELKNLILVQNKGVNKVFKLSSSDGWKTAKIVGVTPSTERLQNPTTLSWNKKVLYVLNAKINELSDSTLKPSDEFSLQIVAFKEKK
jgi:sugar lactone lactonase YvrE